MNENEEINESDLIDAQKESLFTINSNYNTLEVNKMMKSSTNLFSHLSPLFTKTMTSFKKQKNILENKNSKSKTKIIFRNYLPTFENNISKQQKSKIFNSKNFKTQINFKSNNPYKHFLLGPNNPPSIKDKIKLTSYYKSGYNESSNKSPEEKKDKNNLFEKYNIKKKKYNKYNYNSIHYFPQMTDNNMHLKISKPYFKNTYKANKTININKQLVHRVNEMTNFFLLKKYIQKIENNQKNIYFIRKMPKIQIKSKTKKTGYKKENELDEDNNHENNNNKKSKKKFKGLDFSKKINYLGTIKLNRFKKFAYNSLIEFQCEDEDDEFNFLNINNNIKDNKTNSEKK